MRKRKSAVLITALLLLPFVGHTEIVTATSEPFTFPAIDNIKRVKSASSLPMFAYRGYLSATRSITLSWRLPATIDAKKGAITLYSLQGKIVHTFALKTSSGSITWKVPHNQAQNGILLARLSYGTHASTLKLILCK